MRITLAVALVLVATPAAAEPLPDTVEVVRDGPVACKPWILLGLRGSGENAGERDGLGTAVGYFADEFAQQVGTRNVSVVGITEFYEARSVPGWSVKQWRKYISSALDSRDELVVFLRRTSRACPDSKIVLAGYSQGAMVAQLAYDRLLARASRVAWADTTDSVYRVVALASPLQDTGSEPVADGDRGGKRRGVLTMVGFRVGAQARTSSDRVVGFCARKDLVCDFDDLVTVGVRRAGQIHTRFYRDEATRREDYPRVVALTR